MQTLIGGLALARLVLDFVALIGSVGEIFLYLIVEFKKAWIMTIILPVCLEAEVDGGGCWMRIKC